MILHIVKCEMCEGKYKFYPMDRLSIYTEAPPDWFVLFQAKDLPAQEGWHFCSKACLKRWLDEIELANRESA